LRSERSERLETIRPSTANLARIELPPRGQRRKPVELSTDEGLSLGSAPALDLLLEREGRGNGFELDTPDESNRSPMARVGGTVRPVLVLPSRHSMFVVLPT
jgi:hypothetical protein